jgi:hypothetical protein
VQRRQLTVHFDRRRPRPGLEQRRAASRPWVEAMYFADRARTSADHRGKVGGSSKSNHVRFSNRPFGVKPEANLEHL